MNFGQNLFNWLSSNAQPLVLLALLFIGLFLIFKKESTKLVGTILIAIVAVGFVFNPNGVKDLLLSIFNTVFGL